MSEMGPPYVPQRWDGSFDDGRPPPPARAASSSGWCLSIPPKRAALASLVLSEILGRLFGGDQDEVDEFVLAANSIFEATRFGSNQLGFIQRWTTA